MKIETKNLCGLEFELKEKNITKFIKETLEQAAPESVDEINQFFQGGVGLVPLQIITTDRAQSFGVQIKNNGNIGISVQTMILFYMMTEIFWDTFMNLAPAISFGYKGEYFEISSFSQNKMNAIKEIQTWTNKDKTINDYLQTVKNKQIYYSFLRFGNGRNGDVDDMCVNDLYWLSLSAFILHEISHSRNSKLATDMPSKIQELYCDNFAFNLLTKNIHKFRLTEFEKLKGYTIQDVKVKRLVALDLMFCIIATFFSDETDTHPNCYTRIKNLIDTYSKEPEVDCNSSDFFYQINHLGNNFWNIFATTIPLLLWIKNKKMSLLSSADNAKTFCLQNLHLINS